ncbi:MAG: hypothetical protein IIT39_12995 [Clostridia bacterium]|nr:hypothetical protein [Clostridia bacterium]
MIINKVLTEKEKEQVKSLTSFAEIEEIYFRANRRYILSFSKDINMTYTREGVPDDLAPILKLSDSDSEKVRQAILSDVHEILNAITKEEIEEEIRHNDWYFVPDTELKEKLKTPCWGTCWGKLQEILKLQMTAYDYYRLDNLELIELFQKKAAEWYEPPTPPDSKDSKKKETDSGELEELPIIQRVKKPESVCYALFKPTYTLFNNFPIGQTKKLNAASEADRRKGKTANILLLLNFDELEGVKISRTLTIYDKSVWNACANLARCGYEIVTAQDVYRFMGYNNNLNQRDKKKILESIETIIRARVFINNKEEHALYKKYDEISLNTPLLAAEICKAKIGNTVVEEAIRIIEPPKLFAIAEKRGQITTIPFAVLESPINKNDDIALITDYLLIRISRMKNSKQIHRTILLDTLYDKCNITDSASDRMKKSRLPDKINRLLNHYKSVGWIGGYKLNTKEIVIIPEKPEEE